MDVELNFFKPKELFYLDTDGNYPAIEKIIEKKYKKLLVPDNENEKEIFLQFCGRNGVIIYKDKDIKYKSINESFL